MNFQEKINSVRDGILSNSMYKEPIDQLNARVEKERLSQRIEEKTSSKDVEEKEELEI